MQELVSGKSLILLSRVSPDTESPFRTPNDAHLWWGDPKPAIKMCEFPHISVHPMLEWADWMSLTKPG